MRISRQVLSALVIAVWLGVAGCGHKAGSSAPDASGAAQASPGSGQGSGAATAAGGGSGQAAAQPGQAAPGGASGQPATYQVTIPDGTVMDVRLDEPLGSARSLSGERFSATLAAPLVLNGEEYVPEGARVTGRVLVARRSGRLRTPAELSVTLTAFELNERRYPIVASHRTWRAKSHKKHNLKWIAGGSGAGALVGALVGHGAGALIGAGIGAGGGTATAFATGKKDIVLPSETRLRFVLREPVTVTEYRSS